MRNLDIPGAAILLHGAPARPAHCTVPPGAFGWLSRIIGLNFRAGRSFLPRSFASLSRASNWTAQ